MQFQNHLVIRTLRSLKCTLIASTQYTLKWAKRPHPIRVRLLCHFFCIKFLPFLIREMAATLLFYQCLLCHKAQSLVKTEFFVVLSRWMFFALVRPKTLTKAENIHLYIHLFTRTQKRSTPWIYLITNYLVQANFENSHFYILTCVPQLLWSIPSP